MMLSVSPSAIEGALACFRKQWFKGIMHYPVDKSPWQKIGIDGHRGIEKYLLYGTEPEDQNSKLALQLVKPILPSPPFTATEVELQLNYVPSKRRIERERKHGKSPNDVYIFDDWVGRTDFRVHMYADLWPFPDEMDTWDWKFRANLSFRNTPPEDLRDDSQAVMYQLMRSFILTGGWEEPGTHTWQVIDRKRWVREPVFQKYAAGEALERWKLIHEPAVDLMQEVYGNRPKKLDPAKIPDNGFYTGGDSRECNKWRGCDFTRQCMGCGTPVFGMISNFLANYDVGGRRGK